MKFCDCVFIISLKTLKDTLADAKMSADSESGFKIDLAPLVAEISRLSQNIKKTPRKNGMNCENGVNEHEVNWAHTANT